MNIFPTYEQIQQQFKRALKQEHLEQTVEFIADSETFRCKLCEGHCGGYQCTHTQWKSE